MPGTTPRLGLDYALGTDPVSGYPTSDAQAKGILDNAVTYSQGTLVARPAAGLAGRLYYATDTGLYYEDNGTAWGTVLVAGAWSTVTLSGVVPLTGFYTPSARAEGDTVRLKGALKNNGGTIAGGVTLLTLPTGLRPSALVAVSGIGGNGQGIGQIAQITTGGAFSLSSGLASGYVLGLDGATFSLS